MEKKELINKVNEALANEFEVEITKLVPDANIKVALDIDSFGFVDMVAIIEDLFGVKMKGQEMVNIMTFENLYNYLDARVEN